MDWKSDVEDAVVLRISEFLHRHAEVEFVEFEGKLGRVRYKEGMRPCEVDGVRSESVFIGKGDRAVAFESDIGMVRLCLFFKGTRDLIDLG